MDTNFGINVVGTFRAETGFGEAVRGTLSALDKAGILVKIIDLSMKLENRLNDESVKDFAEENTYPVNLVQVNPFMIGRLLKNKEAGFFEGKYNIAYWVWETSEVPDEFLEFAYLFDEIWTASEYCQKAIAQKAAIPVICIPHVAEITADAISPALPVQLDDDKFIFFNIFDFGSLIERKNTLGLIEAFKKAFTSDNTSVQLLIKSSTGFEFPNEKKSVEDAIAEYPNITLLDTMFRRNELLALINRADCYVSLHRSEGFGLNMADAMAIGKPVIATGYSGNMEFMNINNSLPVKYELKEIKHQIPPYSIGSIWSEPDTDHAASLMKYAVANPDEMKKLGQRAQDDMAQGFSTEAISRLIQKRVPVITQKIIDKNEDLTAKLNLANAKTFVLEEKVKYLENTFINKIRRKLKKR
jgi:glycosyltransferase involved in cell wall biosynthesis